MSDVTATPPATPVWRLSVAQYHAMIDTGILTDDDPVELLDGLLVPKMPKKPLHRATTRLVRQALEAILPAGWYVDSQEPITLENSEPEPDVMIVRGDTRDYLDRHPGPADLALVVEIADATLQRDRELKQRLYARAGIPVYWLVDLPARRVEVYGEPQGGEYHAIQQFEVADFVPLIIGGRPFGPLPVADLIPVAGEAQRD